MIELSSPPRFEIRANLVHEQNGILFIVNTSNNTLLTILCILSLFSTKTLKNLIFASRVKLSESIPKLNAMRKQGLNANGPILSATAY
jgi:hypothetical protein